MSNCDLAARLCAVNMLGEVLSKRKPLDEVLDSSHGFVRLESRDRAFCRMLVSTVLRRQGQIDDIIRRSLTNPDQQVKPDVLEMVMRVGVAQIVFMNVADHAAVNSTVELAESCGCERQKGFVNAVMRQTQRNHAEWITKQDPGQLNMPSWLLKSWIKDYGLSTAGKIAEANLCEAALDITVRDPEQSDFWAAALEAKKLPAGRLRLPASKGASVPSMEGFHDGDWWVQDISASMPALLLGDLTDKVVVDVCAAPGGKTMQLCAAGAKEVFAIDRSARRLERLKENMARVGFSEQVDVRVADASVWQPKELVDAVLVDAPCSATGTIRRHPDLLRIKKSQDIADLAAIQAQILDNAVSMLKPGGVLIYCTCSLQKDEGERQIEAALRRHADLKCQPIKADELGGMSELITDAGYMRALPFYLEKRGGMDGFFIARLVRK